MKALHLGALPTSGGAAVQKCRPRCNSRQKVSNWTAWLRCIHFHFKTQTQTQTMQTQTQTSQTQTTQTKHKQHKHKKYPIEWLLLGQIQVQHIRIQREIQLNERHDLPCFKRQSVAKSRLHVAKCRSRTARFQAACTMHMQLMFCM